MPTVSRSPRSEKTPDQTLRRYGKLLPDERRADRRRRVLQAALEAFGQRGFAAVSIEQLCAAARVSTRGFYEEFATKEDVLGALHDDLNERALGAVLAAVAEAPPGDVDARARAGCTAYFDVMTSDRRWASVVLVEAVGVSPAMEARRQAAVDRFASLLEAEAEQLRAIGAIPDRSYGLTAVALVGAIKELATSWAMGASRRTSVDALADEAASLVVVAVSRPVEPPR